MSRKYFGTDGIRGRANGLITPELALKVGQAAGLVFQRGDHRHRVVIGKDTRLSGYMIEYAMVAGFTSVGMDVLLLGPIPTPRSRKVRVQTIGIGVRPVAVMMRPTKTVPRIGKSPTPTGSKPRIAK